VLTQNLKIW